MTLVVKDGNGASQNVATVLNGSSEHEQTMSLAVGGGQTLQVVDIDTLTSGDNTLLAAQVGKVIYVVSYVVVVSAAVSLRWKSGANNKSGAMALTANGGVSVAGSVDSPVLFTNSGEALILNLSSGVQVSGHAVVFVQ